MKILRPFYGAQPRLQPLMTGFSPRLQKAVFWRAIPGITIYKLGMEHEMWSRLYTSLATSLDDAFWHELRDAIGSDRQGELYVSLMQSLQPRFDPWLWPGLSTGLKYACGFRLAGLRAKAASFEPLHMMWFTGNFPVGFDQRGSLLLLVAD